MKPNSIHIDDVEYVKKESIVIPEVDGTPIGKYCIIRCRDAGVWAGVVSSKSGRDCTVIEARRLYEWKAIKGHTLSAVANYGISGGKLPAKVPIVFLTETCEFIPATDDAKTTIVNFKSHNE